MALIAIVPAAGTGSRVGGDVPKQYLDVGGMPLLARTVRRVTEALRPDRTIVAVAPGDAACAPALAGCTGVESLACGGATRAATVRNALGALAASCSADDWVLVHDAARPCVPGATLQSFVRVLADDPVGGLLAIPVADTLKRAGGEDASAPRVRRTEDRRGLWQAQTPQMFRFGILHEALHARGADAATDEAQAVEWLAASGRCAMPRLVPGSPQNVKVTYAGDVALAAAILALQEGGS